MKPIPKSQPKPEEDKGNGDKDDEN